MAKYARSTDGNDADDGTTWALAKATVSALCSVGSAGEDLYVSQVHAESSAVDQTLALPGTISSPTRLICANDGAEPPTASATTGLIEVTGSGIDIFVSGTGYVQGLEFRAGSGALAYSMALGLTAQTSQIYVNCKFTGNSTAGSAQSIFLGSNGSDAGSYVNWSNCNLQFASAAHRLLIRNGAFDWDGGAVVAGAALNGPLFVFGASGRGGIVRVNGVDFSACATGLVICDFLQGTSKFTAHGCKLPSGWTGDVYSGTPPPNFRPAIYNCDSGDTNYRMRVKDNAGNIRDETTIVRTGGASDGTTPISWKMDGNGNCNIANRLVSDQIALWNTTIGSAITATVEVVNDGATLTNGEISLSVEYFGTSGFPLSSFVADGVAGDNGGNILATAASQPTSTETWTTTGLATPVKQKLSVTFTPQEVGFIYATVRLGKASTTVYVDPKITVT